MNVEKPADVDRFGRIAILVLAIEWVLFGSMHFSMTQETVDQIPTWFDPYRLQIAILSGFAEVATGILLLVPVAEVRRKAAISSLVLLGLLLPAMYAILATPGTSAFQTAFKVALLPNNIFLAICSVYLLAHPRASLAAPPRAVGAAAPARLAISLREPVALLVPALLLIANCAGFLAIATGAQGHFGAASLWAMSCIASGALIGFLFGVPRINPSVPLTGRLVPNANVEAVSDWLTKILVGVGLVNFQAIGSFIARLSVDVGRATDTDPAFATGLIVYFFVIGIIQGYILTRMFLTAQFQRELSQAAAAGDAAGTEPAAAEKRPARGRRAAKAVSIGG
jgi:uncharacterized membrane protein